jgi:bisphosphoglycerate-dependent phosphoglycerate mutase
MYELYHPKADVDRLYVKRKGERKGLLQTEVAYKEQIINIAEYLNTKYAEDQFVNIFKSHEINQPNMNSTIKTAAKDAEELNQSNEKCDTKNERIQHVTERLGDSLEKKMGNKVMHGQYVGSMDRQLVSEEDTLL